MFLSKYLKAEYLFVALKTPSVTSDLFFVCQMRYYLGPKIEMC